jgi:hypothetical protein
MANEHFISILLIGGLTGWLGLGIMVYFMLHFNVKEIEMIKEIQQELKIVKEEIKELK